MATDKVQKESISTEDNKFKLDCQFNPDNLSPTKKVKWEKKPDSGGDVSEMIFAGGEAQDFSIPLTFDSTDTGQDVRLKYKALVDMAMIDKSKKDVKTKLSEPPKVMFQWGKFLSFKAVIESLEQKFLMFKADGTPLRAKVTVKFRQVDVKTGAQNPTSRSEARKIWVVEEGQRLDWIAYQEYGDSARWRYIAETNNLDNPLDLRSGQVLKLIPLP